MKRSFVSALTTGFLVVACSSGSAGPIGGASTAGTSSVAGTVAGKAFAFRSGIAHVAKDGSVDVVVTDVDGLCDSITQQKFRAGQTMVQAYGLKGTAPGPFTSDDVKFASLKASCTNGQSVETAVDQKSRAKTTNVTISTIGASEVQGSLDITFEDGSSVRGNFDLPVCATAEAEKATCL